MYCFNLVLFFFFFSSRRRHTRCSRDWSSDVCSSDLMEAAGAVLVGALIMHVLAGEYAYDFTGENVHDGPSRNPHDPTRMSGGSSGGSGSAVGGGLVPIALGRSEERRGGKEWSVAGVP